MRERERGRERKRKTEGRERKRETEQIGTQRDEGREQTTWSNTVFTSGTVPGSRGHVLIGTWPAARAGGSALYVVADDDDG